MSVAASETRSHQLYTPSQRARRDATVWTTVQGVLAPIQFLVCAVSLALVLRFLATADGYTAAMLRRLPKILRFIPGKAQDMRAWFLSMQYWLGGSDDNIESMVRYLVSR